MTQVEYLYRIVSFSRAIDLFESQELHLVSPSQWDDPFEMLLKHKRSHALFAQCWSKRAVSDAMWRVYSPNRQSVRLRTTRQKLLDLSKRQTRDGFDCWVKDVAYETPTQVRIRLLRLAKQLNIKYSIENAVSALELKREAFDYENEVRFIVHNKVLSDNDVCPRSIKINIWPHDFIESVTFDPRVDNDFYQKSKLYLENEINFKGAIAKSALYRPITLPIVAGD